MRDDDLAPDGLPRARCTSCANPEPHLHLFVAQLPDGEDAHDVAMRAPTLLRRIIDEAKPAGVWRAEYLAAHPELSPIPIPDWMSGEDA